MPGMHCHLPSPPPASCLLPSAAICTSATCHLPSAICHHSTSAIYRYLHLPSATRHLPSAICHLPPGLPAICLMHPHHHCCPPRFSETIETLNDLPLPVLPHIPSIAKGPRSVGLMRSAPFIINSHIQFHHACSVQRCVAINVLAAAQSAPSMRAMAPRDLHTCTV
jgi:hypothetical protein